MIIVLMKRPWIEKRLATLNKGKSELAAALGIAPARITEMINGVRDVQVDELSSLANFLQMPLLELLRSLTGETDHPTLDQPLIEVRGRVQAGAWREATEWGPAERFMTSMQIPLGFAESRVFGLVNAGDSMNQVIPDGAVLACVPLEMYPKDVKSGDFVIVERVNKAGETEATVKEYVEAEGKSWLVARSTNPDYRAPIIMNGSDTEEARILAVVVSFNVDLTRGQK